MDERRYARMERIARVIAESSQLLAKEALIWINRMVLLKLQWYLPTQNRMG